jgi:polysaccharide biosynthesis PFTS motif protein
MVANYWESQMHEDEIKEDKFRPEYLKLISQGNLGKLRKAIRACIAFESAEINKKFSKDLTYPLSNIKVQQISSQVNDLLFNPNLVVKLIKSNFKKVDLTYPLPRHWVDIFIENGIPVNSNLCVFQFHKYLLKNLLKNYLKSMLIVASRNNYSLDILSNSTLVYVKAQDFKSHLPYSDNLNFVNWLTRKKIIDHDSEKIYFCTPTASKQSNEISEAYIVKFKLIKTVVALFELSKRHKFQIVKLLFATPNLILEYLNVNDEILKSVSALIVPSSQGWIKASWMSKLEESGIKIIYVNLSDSSEPSITFDEDLPVNWYPLSQWKSVTVCSENQKLIYGMKCPKFYPYRVDLTGVPDWQDLGNFQISNDTKYISVFDFEPHKDHYGYSSNNDSGYSDIRNTLRFLETISELAHELKIVFIYKPKRITSKSKRYSRYSDSLANLSNNNKYFYVADERIAPRRIISKSVASINMPFSSTALIARDLEIPTCFYDIVGLIKANDPGSNGILIINKKAVLAKWVIKQINFNCNN